MTDLNKERYYQCPYCNSHESGHGTRFPKSVGKYRLKILYRDVLIFKCGKCSGIHRLKVNPDKILWDKMALKEKDAFKKKNNITKKEAKT